MRITHPFHPLSGRGLACVGERYNRYGRRFLLQVDEVAVCSVPLQWTDLSVPDTEIVLGEQRALFRVADLLELARLVDQMRERRSLRKAGDVLKPTSPHMSMTRRRMISARWAQSWLFYAVLGVTKQCVFWLDTMPEMRHKYIYVLWRPMPMKSKSKPLKVDALREEGTLNPTPEQVRDPKFQDNEFFDPHDIVQVKYEMLRRVSIENASVSATAEEYGVSRPTYYQTKASFDKAGISGLAPQKRGPRGPHKFRGKALAFVQQQLVAGEPVRARQLAKMVRQKFDLDIHPRTIERAVAGKITPR